MFDDFVSYEESGSPNNHIIFGLMNEKQSLENYLSTRNESSNLSIRMLCCTIYSHFEREYEPTTWHQLTKKKKLPPHQFLLRIASLALVNTRVQSTQVE